MCRAGLQQYRLLSIRSGYIVSGLMSPARFPLLNYSCGIYLVTDPFSSKECKADFSSVSDSDNPPARDLLYFCRVAASHAAARWWLRRPCGRTYPASVTPEQQARQRVPARTGQPHPCVAGRAWRAVSLSPPPAGWESPALAAASERRFTAAPRWRGRA